MVIIIMHIVVFKHQGGVLVHDQNTTLAVWIRRRVSVKRGMAEPAICAFVVRDIALVACFVKNRADVEELAALECFSWTFGRGF